MGLRLITAPTRYPVTLEELKAHLRVETDDDDAYLDSLIEAVATYLDGDGGILGRCLVQQTWEYQIANWACDTDLHHGFNHWPFWSAHRIEIPLPPLVSVTSVKYLDQTEAEQTLASDQYVAIINGWEPSIIQSAYGVTWPIVAWHRPDAVRIRFVAGYASVVNGGLSGTIPRNIVQCMLKAVGTAYENRDQPTDIYIDETLLAPSRLPVVA